VQCIKTIFNFEKAYIEKRLSDPINQNEVWIVGNEADWGPKLFYGNQFRNGQEHGRQFLDYRTLIKSLDPKARIANSGVAWPALILTDGWMDGFLSIVGNTTPDIWNIHTYPRHNPQDWESNRDELHTFRQHLENIGDGGKPLWITEFGVLFHYDVTTQSQVNTYMDNIIKEYASTGLVQKWFWFVGTCRDGEGWRYTCLHIDGVMQPTGIRYENLARSINRIYNESFERDLLGWAQWSGGSGNLRHDTNEYFDGWGSGRIDHNSGPHGTQASQNIGSVSEGENYAVVAWVKSYEGAVARLMLQRTNGGIYTELSPVILQADAQWQRAYTEVAIPAEVTTVQLIVRNTTADTTLYCDAVSVFLLNP
jgi:hypothetical protein